MQRGLTRFISDSFFYLFICFQLVTCLNDKLFFKFGEIILSFLLIFFIRDFVMATFRRVTTNLKNGKKKKKSDHPILQLADRQISHNLTDFIF